MQWIIEAAVEADIFQSVIVSSDDPKILFMAQEMDGVTPLSRPLKLCGDDVRAEEVFKHIVEFVGLVTVPDIVCMAMPTAPFTHPDSLRGAYNKMTRLTLDGLFLAAETPFRTQRTVEDWDSDTVTPVGDDWDDMGKQSQDLPKTYRPTYGGMFIETEILLATTRYYGFQQGIYEVKHPEGIDIDTEEDWLAAERYLRERSEEKSV